MAINIKENQILDLEITDITGEGYGIARFNNIVVMVPDTVLGDKCKVKIEKIGKSCLYGKLDEIVEPSSIRTESDCNVFSECGGCTFRNISYDSELKIKEKWVKDSIYRIGGINKTDILPIIPSPKQIRYRNKAIYQIGKGNDGKSVFGFYKKKSHDILNCENCLLQPTEFEDIILAVKFFIDENKISIYNEKTGKGLLRALYIRKAEQTGEIGITLVVNGSNIPNSNLFVSFISEKFSSITSIVINENRENTNVVLGKKYSVIYGKDHITDNLCGRTFDISPASFYQVNHNAAEILYGIVKKYADVRENDTILDLYCGTGTIGLSIIGQTGKLIGVEIVPEAIINAKKNATINDINNCDFICSDAGKAANMLCNNSLKPTTIIVDPPRKGCSLDTIDTIMRMESQKIIYVSCNYGTLARDIGILCTSGYHVDVIQPVDLFPRTCHVESVALLSKVKE